LNLLYRTDDAGSASRLDARVVFCFDKYFTAAGEDDRAEQYASNAIRLFDTRLYNESLDHFFRVLRPSSAAAYKAVLAAKGITDVYQELQRITQSPPSSWSS